MRILVISDNYPSPAMPTVGVFVYKFVQQLAKAGHKVSVISPFQLVPRKVKLSRNYYGEELAKVYSPKYLSFSTKKIGPFNTYSIAKNIQIQAIKRIVKRENIEFDFVYCHFVKNALLGVAALGKLGKPIFASVGENKNLGLVQKWYGRKEYMSLFNQIQGFIAVSSFVGEKLKAMGVPDEKILVAPNGTNLDVFSPGDKFELRKKHGLPQAKFIVAFTGRLTHDKGPLRLLKAIEGMKDLGVIFMGEGEQVISGDQVLFNGKVPSYMMPELLSCADLFVLPTRHEGSNNAIVEAIACGLPIISSDIPEIREQCKPEFSILVDPMDVVALRNAILTIKENPKIQNDMSEKARSFASNFDIKTRAEKVIQFIQEQF